MGKASGWLALSARAPSAVSPRRCDIPRHHRTSGTAPSTCRGGTTDV
ncbi:hypothetical protein HMPREF1549_02371 [Actinomyces johnsonii F0510]|uniref:Uncharacterized protein n=1 Tax=Actinomyces johnsonii F0510 TaxID=1227262 RepID=U1RGE7_9ACTO|nr:hypothetical protein HMPREF1549_02371 [Actinomyces johnsonii F0510]